MKPHVTTLALTMFAAGCSGEGGDSPAPPTAAPPPAATPSPSPTPSPSLTPTPGPSAMPASYMTFSDVYVFRLGGSYGILLPSASSGFIFQGQPPAVLPATAFGQGLAFRFILTPQVWAITGDVSTGFDNRSGDPFSTGPEPGLEVGYSRSAGPNIVRFTITRPAVAGTGLDYTRLATVSAPVQGANRQYQCVLGIPTLAQDLTASVSGRFQRNVVTATAYVRDGSTARAYSLGRSAVAISADMAARQVTISLRLVGTPTGTAGPDVDLGAFAATAPIDQTTGNFVASLTSSDRSVTGSISGQFFGPQAVEIGAAFGASVSDTAGAPAFSFAGAVHGAR